MLTRQNPFSPTIRPKEPGDLVEGVVLTRQNPFSTQLG